MNTIEATVTEEDLFKLSAAVGRNQENNPLDVAKVEALMGAAGHLDIEKTDGPTGYFGQRLEGAVKDFQKEKNLAVDGLVKPDGETVSHPSLAFKRIDTSGIDAKQRSYQIGETDISIQLDDEMQKWSDDKIIKYLINGGALEKNADPDNIILKALGIIGQLKSEDGISGKLIGGKRH
ncbi:MAG: peptidoglycan-binding protein [Rhodospirillaceae bacterium]|nr:peptidoglycan-binding protein [Rhodospirillaceae bacterium]